ncbi:hypothetical protein LA080_007590 [Diaporthe eres]|nr:hypothetical protein LA080_007590 [Diaporthe eres]
MQWTVMTVIPLVSLILTAILAPLGWVIQRYWTSKADASTKLWKRMASLSGSIEVIRVALNSTVPDEDGAKFPKELPERLSLVDEMATSSRLSD